MTKLWNNGNPVWNKGKRMKPATEATCGECGCKIEVTCNKLRCRLKKGGVTYCSPECRKVGKARKISKSLMGHKYHPVTEAGQARRSAANRGRIPWNKGKKHSEATKEKQRIGWLNSESSRAHLRRIQTQYSGANSPHWKGGVTPKHRALRSSLEAKLWRKTVMERDNYTCQMCGKRGGNLHADHIKPFAAFPDLRFDPENGRTLCVACHRKTPTYGRPKAHA